MFKKNDVVMYNLKTNPKIPHQTIGVVMDVDHDGLGMTISFTNGQMGHFCTYAVVPAPGDLYLYTDDRDFVVYSDSVEGEYINGVVIWTKCHYEIGHKSYVWVFNAFTKINHIDDVESEVTMTTSMRNLIQFEDGLMMYIKSHDDIPSGVKFKVISTQS